MPIQEIDKRSITFTEEAESALARLLRRLEKQLRAGAVGEAMATRGTFGEVTASDINKAFRELVISRRLSSTYYRDLLMHGDLPPSVLREVIEEDEGVQKKSSPQTFPERVATVYMKGGIWITLVGLLYAIGFNFFTSMLSNKVTRQGLLISAVGIATALVGYLFRSFYHNRMLHKK